MFEFNFAFFSSQSGPNERPKEEAPGEMPEVMTINHVDKITLFAQVHPGVQPLDGALLRRNLLDHRPFPCILRLVAQGIVTLKYLSAGITTI